jgi:hypothetical protein
MSLGAASGGAVGNRSGRGTDALEFDHYLKMTARSRLRLLLIPRFTVRVRARAPYARSGRPIRVASSATSVARSRPCSAHRGRL